MRERDLRPRGSASGRRIVLVASQVHSALVRRLVHGARRVLLRHGAKPATLRLVWAPGAFELPMVAARIARGEPPPEAIIALGVLIRGETSQYAVLAHAVAQGLMQVSLETRIPVTSGVIVAETRAQAVARAGGRAGNRGEEAAFAALEMLRIFEAPRGPR